MPEIKRFQRNVALPLSNIEGVLVEVVEQIKHESIQWPLYCIRPSVLNPHKKTVLISAGVHGDEPAGVHAAIAFLQGPFHQFAESLQIVVFPCLNPSGFEFALLTNAAGANLNRQFGTSSDEPEIAAVEQWLTRQSLHFVQTFDLHEARPDYSGEGFTAKDNPRAVYLYETVSGAAPRIGRTMLDSLDPRFKICDWPTIYDDINERGLIAYPEARRNKVYAEQTSFDSFLHNRYTNHSFTLETPTGWDLRDRVAVHLSLLQTALVTITQD